MTEEQTGGEAAQPYLSTGEAARILGVSPESVWQNIQRGRIQAIRVGRNWIIPRESFDEFASTYVKGPGRRRRKDNMGGKT